MCGVRDLAGGRVRTCHMFGYRRIVRAAAGSRVSKRPCEENKEFPPGRTYLYRMNYEKLKKDL
jgi:hypothetical protein